MNSPVLKVWPLADGVTRGFIAAGPRWIVENGRCGIVDAGATATGAADAGVASAAGATSSGIVLPTWLSDTDTVPFDASLLLGEGAGVVAGAIFLRAATNAAAAFRDAAGSIRCGSAILAVVFAESSTSTEAGAVDDLRLASLAPAFKGSRAARMVVDAFRLLPFEGASVIGASPVADRVFVGIGRTVLSGTR